MPCRIRARYGRGQRGAGSSGRLPEYGVGANMLADLGVSRFRIMTNNPAKLTGLDGYGLEIVDRVPVEIASNPENEKYLETKRTRMGHGAVGGC